MHETAALPEAGTPVTDEFEAILAAARAGDQDAWTEIYDEVAPLILGYLRGHRIADPEDLTGEVMLQVVRDIATFGGDRRAFRSWTLSIAHHRMIDRWRYEARRPSHSVAPEDLPPLVDDADPGAAVSATAGLEQLIEHLDVLTEEQRAVLLLRTVADLSVRDVARITGKRPGAVKAMQHRAVATLRAHLAGPEPAPAATPSITSAQRTVRAAGEVAP